MSMTGKTSTSYIHLRIDPAPETGVRTRDVMHELVDLASERVSMDLETFRDLMGDSLLRPTPTTDARERHDRAEDLLDYAYEETI